MTIPASQFDTWVFVDTGAYFALIFTGDENHPAARSLYEQLTTEGRQLVTTNFVLAETHALLLNRLNRTIALRVLDATSFVVMERLGLRTAFAFDRHFAQYGLTVLPPPRR
jgi:uncharacterized protein